MIDTNKMATQCLWLTAILLLLAAGPAMAATTIQSLVASPGSVQSGETVSVTYEIVTTGDHFPEPGVATISLVRDGVLVSSVDDRSILITSNIGQGGSITGTLPIDLTDYQTPGTYTAGLSIAGREPGANAPVNYSDTATTTFEVTAVAATPITVNPPALGLQGGPGETPTTTFTITAGTPPFTLVSANPDGRGSFSNASPGLNEVVTYGFRIPGAATDQDQFNDTITVTGDDGAIATIVATTTAVVGGIGQDDIDDAMQAIAQTPPQRAMAAAISAICPAGVAEPQLQEDCNAMVGGSLAPGGSPLVDQASVALGQVTADQASAPVNASQTSIQSQTRNVGTRIAALRGGASGFSSRGLSINIDGQNLPGGQLADEMMRTLGTAHGGAAGSDTAMDFGRWSVFVNGSIGVGDKDRTDNVAGYDFDSIALTLGADYRFSDNLVAGAALGYSRNDTDLDANGGDLEADGVSLSLYGTYYQESGLYLDGIFNYGRNDYDQRRNIRYTIGTVDVNQAALSDFDGNQWSAAFGGGYSMSRGALTFGPTARLEYVKTDVDGYQERMRDPTAPGGGWAARINSQEVESFNIQLGGEVSYAMSTSWGVLLPNVQLEWVHEFEDGAQNVVGHLVQDTSRTLFSLPTDVLDEDYFNLSLGLSAQFAQGRSGYIQFRKLLGYSDLDAYTIAAGFRMEF